MRRLQWAIGGAALVVALLGVLASSLPDGLGRVAESLGFASRESAVVSGSPFAGYATRYFGAGWLAQASAGLLGVVLIYGFGVLFGRTLKRKK